MLFFLKSLIYVIVSLRGIHELTNLQFYKKDKIFSTELQFFKFQRNLMLSYASAVSCMCDIFVKFSAVSELQSFKSHATGQKFNINVGSLIV